MNSAIRFSISKARSPIDQLIRFRKSKKWCKNNSIRCSSKEILSHHSSKAISTLWTKKSCMRAKKGEDRKIDFTTSLMTLL